MLNPAQLQWALDHPVSAVAGALAIQTAAAWLLRGVARRTSGRRRPLVDSAVGLLQATVALVRALMAHWFMNSSNLPARDRDEVNRRAAEGIAGLDQSADARTPESDAPRPPERRRGRHARRRHDEG